MAGSADSRQPSRSSYRSGLWRPGWTLNLYADAAEAGGCLRVPSAGGVRAEGAGSGAFCVGGSAAGAGDDPPLLRGEPAEPTRDAHLCRVGVSRSWPSAPRRRGLLQAAARGAWRADVRLPVGSGVASRRPRAPFSLRGWPVHQAVADPRCVGPGARSHQDAWQSTCRSGRGRWRRRGSLPAIWRSTRRRRWTASGYRASTAMRSRRGSSPGQSRWRGATADDVIDHASALMGARPEQEWRSSRGDGWRGPPSCWVAWSR